MFPSLSIAFIIYCEFILETMKTQQDLITDNNQIQEGLNFIVPLQWWKSFLSKNQNIQSFRQMRLPSFNPLEYLYEAGIVQFDHNTSEQESKQLHKSYHNIIKAANDSLNLINKQVKQAQIVQNNESSIKRNNISCFWPQQTNKIYQEDCDLFLHSPKVQQEMVQIFQLGDQSWVLVAPQLYRLIWQKEAQHSKDKNKNELTAIPVVMRKSNIQNFDKTIIFSNKHNLEVFFKNFSGYSFIFKGYIDNDICINELVRFLDNGFFRLIHGSTATKYSELGNIILKTSNSSNIYFQSKNQQEYESLGWVPFQQIKYKSLLESQVEQVCIFKANPFKKSDLLNQNEEQAQIFVYKKLKKLKEDIISSNSGNSTDAKTLLRKDDNQQAASDRNELHSSTEQQTPFAERQQRNPNKIQNNSIPSDLNRIPYPIWEQAQHAQHLAKYGQVKIAVPKILRPYSQQPLIVLRDQGKKVVLPRLCNELLLNEQKQLIQKQKLQAEVDLRDQAPSQWVKKQLETLALQILGIKISEAMQDAQKVEEGDLKSNYENQSKTCKNEFMDELDCEESRQF